MAEYLSKVNDPNEALKQNMNFLNSQFQQLLTNMNSALSTMQQDKLQELQKQVSQGSGTPMCEHFGSRY